MTLSEFRAWFDGFTEDMSGTPNKKQWERIQARVKEISGAPVSYPVYIDRYVRPHWDRPYWATYGISIGAVGMAAQTHNANAQSPNSLLAVGSVGSNNAFDSHAAMHDLGRLDATALTN